MLLLEGNNTVENQVTDVSSSAFDLPDKPATANINVDDSWKVSDLKAEALRRDLKPAVKKSVLIEQLVLSSKLYDLSDNGFLEAFVAPHQKNEDLPCFPHIYESATDISELRKKMTLEPAPSSIGKL